MPLKYCYKKIPSFPAISSGYVQKLLIKVIHLVYIINAIIFYAIVFHVTCHVLLYISSLSISCAVSKIVYMYYGS